MEPKDVAPVEATLRASPFKDEEAEEPVCCERGFGMATTSDTGKTGGGTASFIRETDGCLTTAGFGITGDRALPVCPETDGCLVTAGDDLTSNSSAMGKSGVAEADSDENEGTSNSSSGVPTGIGARLEVESVRRLVSIETVRSLSVSPPISPTFVVPAFAWQIRHIPACMQP